jgi:hypothetical protein
MKRVALVVLPILSVVIVLGLGLLVVRTHPSLFGPRSAAPKDAEHVVEEVAEKGKEAVE